MEPRVAFCRNRAGQRIAYMTWGEGPVLVVPPGWISHLELQWHYLGMEDLYGRLAGSFRLVVYDRRGAGLSERARDDFTLEAELADMEAVLDEAAPDGEVSLLGISQAGALAIAYAAAHPERVRRLVLFGAYDRGELLAPAEVRASLVALVRASWGIGSHALASIFVPEADPVFLARLARFQREAVDKDMAAALLESGYGYDVREAMAAVRAPTLVIHRRGDRATKSHFGVDLAAGIRGARLVMLEGDIHFPWLGEWEAVAELVEDFVLDQGKPKTERPREAPAPREPPVTRHQLVHYRVSAESEQPSSRIALAQIGEPADLPIPAPSGLYRLPEARVEPVADKLRAFVERAAEGGAELIVFPEMSVDLNHALLEERIHELAREHRMVLVLGGYHDEKTRTNVCVVLGPEGLLWKQRKHIPAFLRAGSDWIAEPIETPPSPLYVVGATKLGRVAIAICRDFLDLELRVALKNSEPPIDLVLNPAFSPVTADFQGRAFRGAPRALRLHRVLQLRDLRRFTHREPRQARSDDPRAARRRARRDRRPAALRDASRTGRVGLARPQPLHPEHPPLSGRETAPRSSCMSSTCTASLPPCRLSRREGWALAAIEVGPC